MKKYKPYIVKVSNLVRSCVVITIYKIIHIANQTMKTYPNECRSTIIYTLNFDI